MTPPRRSAAALAVFGIFVVLGLMSLDAATMMGLALVAVSVYPFVRGVRGSAFDPFEPVYGFFAYTIFTVLIRGWIDLEFGSPILDPQFDVGSPEFRALMAWVFGYTGLFLVAFLFGYYSRFGSVLSAPLPPLRSAPLSRLDLVLALVASVAISVPAALLLRDRLGEAVAGGEYLAASREGGFTWIVYLLRFAVTGASILVLHAARRRGALTLVAASGYLMVCAIAVFALSPTKIVVANALLLVLGAVHYLRRPISTKVLLLTGVVGLIAVPIMTAYRTGLRGGAILQVLRVLPSRPELLLAGVFQRSYGADSFALILDGIAKGHPLEGGRTLGGLFWWWVPRGLWPGKPGTYAIEFWDSFLRQSDYFPQYVSASPTMVGELYLNFWWPGLLLGGFILGVLFRAIYLWFRSSRVSEVSVLLYITVLSGLVKAVEGPIADHIEETEVGLILAVTLLVGMGIASRLLRPLIGTPRSPEAHAHRV